MVVFAEFIRLKLCLVFIVTLSLGCFHNDGICSTSSSNSGSIGISFARVEARDTDEFSLISSMKGKDGLSKRLRTIRLSNVSVTEKFTKYLFSGEYQKIKSVSFNECSLYEIPCGKIVGEIETLELAGNMIRDLSGIENFRNLRKLKLSNNVIEFGIEKICKLERLESLNLSLNNSIVIPKCLRGMRVLRTVNLSRCEIDVEDLSCLPDSLEELFLAECNIEKISLDDRYLERITFLDISDNPLREFPNEFLKCPKLKILDISNTNINEIPEDLWYLPSLKQVLLVGNGLELEDLNLPIDDREKLREIEDRIHIVHDMNLER